VRRTGLARATVARRPGRPARARARLRRPVEALPPAARPTLLAFNPRRGLVLVGDLGATHSRLVASDLAGVAARGGDVRHGHRRRAPRSSCPGSNERFLDLLKDIGAPPARRGRGIGVGVPGPVAFLARRAPFAPPIMPGWDGFLHPRLVRGPTTTPPVLVDNDVNIMALGEHWTHWRDVEHLFVREGRNGIGCGIVARPSHSTAVAQGAAGDIGHIRIGRPRRRRSCRCGKRRLPRSRRRGPARSPSVSRRPGSRPRRQRDVVGPGPQRARPLAIQIVSATPAATWARWLASSVNFFNPRRRS